MTDADARYVVAKDIHVRRFNGELVILDLSKGDYFGVNEIGAALWAGLELGKTPREVAIELAPTYDVALDTLLADLISLATLFASRGLVRRAEDER